MSAFVVNEKHLQTLVNWSNIHDVYFYFDGKRYDSKAPGVPDLLLTVLYRQNVRSVDHRYKLRSTVESLRFKLMPQAGDISPVQILKACDCYDYQANETDDYKESFARDIVDRIRSHAITKLPGYDAAKWEIQ